MSYEAASLRSSGFDYDDLASGDALPWTYQNLSREINERFARTWARIFRLARLVLECLLVVLLCILRAMISGLPKW